MYGAKGLTYPIWIKKFTICQLVEHLWRKSESQTLFLMLENQGKHKVIKMACNAN